MAQMPATERNSLSVQNDPQLRNCPTYPAAFWASQTQGLRLGISPLSG